MLCRTVNHLKVKVVSKLLFYTFGLPMEFICSTKGKNIVSLGITLNKVWSFSAVKQINDADNKTKESSPKVSADKQSLRTLAEKTSSWDMVIIKRGLKNVYLFLCCFIFRLSLKIYNKINYAIYFDTACQTSDKSATTNQSPSSWWSTTTRYNSSEELNRSAMHTCGRAV